MAEKDDPELKELIRQRMNERMDYETIGLCVGGPWHYELEVFTLYQLRMLYLAYS